MSDWTKAIAPKDRREFIRGLIRKGWDARPTNGGHVRLTAPGSNAPIFTSTTSSDTRSLLNLKQTIRNVLKVREV